MLGAKGLGSEATGPARNLIRADVEKVCHHTNEFCLPGTIPGPRRDPDMPYLSFVIPPVQIGRLHGMLTCLAKFDENISLEASMRSLRISSLNSSKSAHASFTLKINSCLVNYTFRPDKGPGRLATTQETWACMLQNRALLSILKKRYSDAKDHQSALERCEFELQDRAEESQCRLVIRMICCQGVVKTYRLTYEPADVLSANFDGNTAKNYWSIPARALRDVVEFFGVKADHLDWALDNGKVNFISYTERIADGKEIFKQPMQTSVAVEQNDFADFRVQEGLRIGILVRDFRAIVAHADGLGINVAARYSRGNMPMQLMYEDDGMLGEFTLMTRRSSDEASTGKSAATYRITRESTVRSAQNQSSQRVPPLSHGRSPRSSRRMSSSEVRSATAGVPVDTVTSMHRTTKARPECKDDPRAEASTNPNQESLFFSAGDEEHFWDEQDDDTAKQDDFVTWDANAHGTTLPGRRRLLRDNELLPTLVHQPFQRNLTDIQELAPTQRLSQLKGLFD